MEHEAAGDRAGLGKPHLDLLRQAKRKAGPASGQRLLPFIVLPVIVRQRAHRHEAACAALRDCDEKSESRHTRNSRSEIRANFVRHVCSKVTVDGVTFGQLGAAFGRRDVLRRVGEALRPRPRQARRRRVAARGSARDAPADRRSGGSDW